MHFNQNNAVPVPVLQGFNIENGSPAEMCEKLAKSHYENFTVGSFLLPHSLRRHVYNIYAYCRICDDLADETNDPQLSLQLLDWWREELHSCYAGKPRHSVFTALSETISEFDLPIKPFEDLISAFIQDQTVTRYATFDQLLDYCSRSANPVGRLYLYLLGYKDEARHALADCTCTALQLANFWQDIASDYLRGRIYIPQEDMDNIGYTEAELRNHIVNASFIRLMRFEITRTRELFERGAALPQMISGPASADVALFTSGGRALLRSIERMNYAVFNQRITVSKPQKALMIALWCIGRLGRRVSQ